MYANVNAPPTFGANAAPQPNVSPEFFRVRHLSLPIQHQLLQRPPTVIAHQIVQRMTLF